MLICLLVILYNGCGQNWYQQELNGLQNRLNEHIVRKDKKKLLPSGVSPNVAYALYQQYNAEYCLQPVDTEIVEHLMEEIGGEDLIQFVTPDYAIHAQTVYDSLDVHELLFHNVWYIFSSMLPLMHALY